MSDFCFLFICWHSCKRNDGLFFPHIFHSKAYRRHNSFQFTQNVKYFIYKIWFFSQAKSIHRCFKESFIILLTAMNNLKPDILQMQDGYTSCNVGEKFHIILRLRCICRNAFWIFLTWATYVIFVTYFCITSSIYIR